MGHITDQYGPYYFFILYLCNDKTNSVLIIKICLNPNNSRCVSSLMS